MWECLMHSKCCQIAKQGLTKIRGAVYQQLLFKVEVIDLMSVLRKKALFNSKPLQHEGHLLMHSDIYFSLCVGTQI